MPKQHAASQDIHNLMQALHQEHDILPCRDLAAYLTMLELSGLVSPEQVEQIEQYYDK